MLFNTYFNIKKDNTERRRSIRGDPGPVSRLERKGAKSKGRRAPWYRLSLDHFQKFKRILASDWGQKCLLFLCPNREQHIWSSFCVFVHDGYFLAIPVRFVHQGCACKGNFHIYLYSLTRNEGTTDDSGRHFGCYQQQHSSLHRETVVAPFLSTRLTAPRSPRMMKRKTWRKN